MSSAHPVLFLAYYYPPEKTSGAERPRRFVRYLPEFGYAPAVVAADGLFSARIVRPDQPEEKQPLSKVQAKLANMAHRVFWHLHEGPDRIPWTPQATAAGARVLSPHPRMPVISTSPPLATHFAAMRLQSRFGCPWIADFRDPFADNPIRSFRLQKRYDPILERRIFERASAIIANTDAVADLWTRRYPQHKQKIHLIWNGFDPAEDFHPLPAIPRKQRVLAHVGDIYGMRNPATVLQSIERLRSAGRLHEEQLRVDLIGPADTGSPMWSSPAFQSLSSRGMVSCNNQAVPRKEAMQAIAEADFLLLLDLNPSQGNLQVPAKIFDYVRAGRPVLAATREKSAVDRILSQSGIPYTRLAPDDSEEVLDGKMEAFLTQAPGSYEPNQWFWNEFDGRNQTRALAGILDGIRAI